jgi:hypothetical protein
VTVGPSAVIRTELRTMRPWRQVRGAEARVQCYNSIAHARASEVADPDVASLREHSEHLMFFGRFAMIGVVHSHGRRGEESMPLTNHVPMFGSQVVYMLLEVQSCALSWETRDEFYACR